LSDRPDASLPGFWRSHVNHPGGFDVSSYRGNQPPLDGMGGCIWVAIDCPQLGVSLAAYTVREHSWSRPIFLSMVVENG
jgi:hypothetical protein